MKKHVLIAALAMIVAFSACKDPVDEIYTPSSKLEGINDVWVLAEVHQYDPSDREKEQVLDVTEVFMDQPVELTVNSNDFTYSFNSDNPLFMGTNGTWKFDNDEAPSSIAFRSLIGSDSTTFSCNLNRTVRAVDQTLEFELTRFCEGGTPTTIYQYKFRRK